jgi:hypothetical protein
VTISAKDERATALPKALNRAILKKWKELYERDFLSLALSVYDGGKTLFTFSALQSNEDLRGPRTWLMDLPREGGRNRAFEIVLAEKAELRIDDLTDAVRGKARGAFPQHILQARQICFARRDLAAVFSFETLP